MLGDRRCGCPITARRPLGSGHWLDTREFRLLANKWRFGPRLDKRGINPHHRLARCDIARCVTTNVAFAFEARIGLGLP